MGLLGILVGLSILVWFAFRGWSVLLLAPAAALVAAAFGGQPLLASAPARSTPCRITARCIRVTVQWYGQ
jgi:H+/gluconate symporter-like permease